MRRWPWISTFYVCFLSQSHYSTVTMARREVSHNWVIYFPFFQCANTWLLWVWRLTLILLFYQVYILSANCWHVKSGVSTQINIQIRNICHVIYCRYVFRHLKKKSKLSSLIVKTNNFAFYQNLLNSLTFTRLLSILNNFSVSLLSSHFSSLPLSPSSSSSLTTQYKLLLHNNSSHQLKDKFPKLWRQDYFCILQHLSASANHKLHTSNH